MIAVANFMAVLIALDTVHYNMDEVVVVVVEVVVFVHLHNRHQRPLDTVDSHVEFDESFGNCALERTLVQRNLNSCYSNRGDSNDSVHNC